MLENEPSWTIVSCINVNGQDSGRNGALEIPIDGYNNSTLLFTVNHQ